MVNGRGTDVGVVGRRMERSRGLTAARENSQTRKLGEMRVIILSGLPSNRF